MKSFIMRIKKSIYKLENKNKKLSKNLKQRCSLSIILKKNSMKEVLDLFNDLF